MTRRHNVARMKWASRIAVTLLAFLSSGCTRHVANAADQQRASSAMFDQFETVFYAKSDFLSGSGGYKGLSQQDANILRGPFADLLQGLDVLGKPASDEILRNTDAVLVGAKDFRPPAGPTGLGDVQSRFCYAVVLAGRSTFDFGKITSKSAAVSSAETSTLKWAAQRTEGHPEPHPFYAMQVAQSYVLISNNLDDLHAMAAKLSVSNAVSGLSGIREWESISQHEVWGYRLYQHNEENKAAAGTSEVMPDAQALVFFLDLKQKVGVVRLFSPTAGTAEKLDGTRMLPPFKAAGTGTWETTIPLSGDAASGERMVGVMGLFGFGVYV